MPAVVELMVIDDFYEDRMCSLCHWMAVYYGLKNLLHNIS